MKCIVNQEGLVKRVRDEQASQLTKKSLWAYCPKSEWKDQEGRKTEPANPTNPRKIERKKRKEGK
jgi:hypothetical protein